MRLTKKIYIPGGELERLREALGFITEFLLINAHKLAFEPVSRRFPAAAEASSLLDFKASLARSLYSKGFSLYVSASSVRKRKLQLLRKLLQRHRGERNAYCVMFGTDTLLSTAGDR